MGEWIQRDDPMETLLERVLEDRRTSEQGWFYVDHPRRLFEEHRSRSRDRTEILWELLNLDLWVRVCTDGGGPKGMPRG